MNRKASILLLVTPGMHMMGSVVAVMDATAVVHVVCRAHHMHPRCYKWSSTTFDNAAKD